MNLRRTSVVASIATLALATAACTGDSSTSTNGDGSSTSSDSGVSSSGAEGDSPAAPAEFLPEHAGGTLHLVAKAAGGSLDPMVNYTLQYWQLFQATYDGLVAFTKQAGDASFTVVPDLATSLPKVSNGD